MNIRDYITFWLLSFISLLPMAVSAQENYFFTHLKSDAGLPHQQVGSMAFDHDGMLWVGTRNGLAKYDGYSFVTYYHNPEDNKSIPHNYIRDIFVDSENNVWIGTDRAICCYQRETDNFRRYDVKGESITHIAETQDGSIICTGTKIFRMEKGEDIFIPKTRQLESYIVDLIVSPDNRVFISTNHGISYFTSEMTAETMLDSSIYSDFLSGFDAIAPLYFDNNGLLWVGRDGKGAMCLNLMTGEKQIYDAQMLSDGTVRVITEDSKGNIWLGTEKGITTINPTTGVIHKNIQRFGNLRTLSDNAIYCIVPDNQDNMWIGTYFGGINIMLRNAIEFQWIAPGYDKMTFSGKAIRRIVEPEKNILWLATEDGGINIFDIEHQQVDRFNAIPRLGTNVHELYYDNETGDMWIGTFRNGLFRYNLHTRKVKHYTAFNSGLKSNAIFAITRQNNGQQRLWIATTLGLMFYDPETDSILPVNHPVLDIDFVYCLYADHRGNLWSGTVNRGLFRIDGETGEIKGWDNDFTYNSKKGLKDNFITSIYEDNNGRVFIGTNNGGVQIIDSNSLEFIELGESPENWGTICSIGQDLMDNIWITTSNGLYKLNPNDLSYIRFTTTDGLPENQFNFSSMIQASDNKVYCGTVNGLVLFNPNITKHSEVNASVHLWRLSLNNDIVTPQTPDSPLTSALDATALLELDYNSSRIFSIDYGIIDPVGAKNVKYQIFIEGLDKEWRDVGNQRKFTAMELPYGNYSFNVRALASGNDWENAPIKKLDLKINPPFYLSSMAWIIYILATISVCYIVYRLFLWRMKEKQQKKLNQIERAKKDELNREKMEFFTNISHELKTPLSLILAPLKQLSSNEPMSEESRERLSTAIANTSKMVDLINELVTFNRVESGNFQLFLQKGNPLTLIETMIGYFRGPASDKNISINVMTQNNGEDVWFSPTYLERIISNLLSNAIKYTGDNGTIDVRASIIEGEDNSVYLQFEVKDTGIGIVPEELDNVFKKYYQTRRGYNASHSGWGIGLATVKKLVEIHKGHISVTSKVGEGSTFVVRLNVTSTAFDKSFCISTNETPTTYQPTFISNTSAVYSHVSDDIITEKDDNKVSILLVEDNPQLLRFLSDEFSKDYNVYTATNGIEALKVTEEYPIDIVVSDVMMPEMDGIELCDMLKNNLATSHIPVILLTAKSDEESTMAGFKSGAEAYVAKPFDPQLLVLRVKNILRARRAYIDSKIEESSVDEAIEELPPLNKFDNEFVAHINKLIDDNIDNSDFSIADITRELGISRSLLHIKMKTFFNSSMTDYIKQRRMSKACELMKEGNNVSETAYRTGFSDPNYFSKVFRKTYGMSPTDYISSLSSE